MINSGLSQITMGRTRSITAENLTGQPGQGGRATTGTGAEAARDLGQGWKVSPSIVVPAGSTVTLADLEGPGTIRHLWMTTSPMSGRRTIVLRATWDNCEVPSVEVPLADFFGQGWDQFAPIASVPVAVTAYGGYNAYWEMPFTQRAVIALDNIGAIDATVYFQIDYELDEPANHGRGYFHSCWRRTKLVPDGQIHTLMDTAAGVGHYVGTYLAWDAITPGWWGEGEMKFYVDEDDEFPTICGTGLEDYVGGAWGFERPGAGYQTYSNAYLGFHEALTSRDIAHGGRFGMYRWHIPDPIRFRQRLRVTVQSLGWQPDNVHYRMRQDDVATTAFWYQDSAGNAGSHEMTATSLDIL